VLEVVEPDRRRRDADLNALLEEFNIARLRKTPAIALSGGDRRSLDQAAALVFEAGATAATRFSVN
jgi:lipopolysaccharide export system ATP-binding protein